MFSNIIMIVSLFLFCLIYLIAFINKHKWFEQLNKKSIRMAYYFFCVTWATIFFLFNSEKIIAMKLFENYKINQYYLNIVIFFITVLAISIIWDILFISCKSIKSLKFKDTEISLEEAAEIKGNALVKSKDIEFLYTILDIKHKLISCMEQYVRCLDYFDDNMYINLIKKYANLRKDTKFKYFYYNNEGLNKFKNDYKFSDMDFSTIQYSLEANKVFVPDKKERDKFFTIINTKFSKYDFIIVLESKKFLNDEHLILQNLTSLLDTYVSIENDQVMLEDLQSQAKELNYTIEYYEVI